MSHSASNAASNRIQIAAFDDEFTQLHSRYISLIQATPEKDLYRRSAVNEGTGLPSVAESVLRGAGSNEQTFGGITANRWDDPFEWTLPEHLSTAARLIEYLQEVEATRQHAFLSFTSDLDLGKEIVLPSGAAVTLGGLLNETLARAVRYCDWAAAAVGVREVSSFTRQTG